MKPAPFEYFAPRAELSEALELLDQHGDDAKVLAGGQSLLPLMSLRLARPSVIIDINRLAGLDTISQTADGGLRVGALTRQRALERSQLVRDLNPLLAAALPWIGHSQIRNRGTVGGSLAHADPAAELPALSVALGMEFVLQKRDGERIVAAEDFYLGYMMTSLEADELLTEIRIPRLQPGLAWATDEISRRRGDFAIVGVVAWLDPDEKGGCREARIVLFGVSGKPLRMQGAENLLREEKLEPKTLQQAARLVSQELQPDSDLHASSEYRKEVGGILTGRALERALLMARGDQTP